MFVHGIHGRADSERHDERVLQLDTRVRTQELVMQVIVRNFATPRVLGLTDHGCLRKLGLGPSRFLGVDVFACRPARTTGLCTLIGGEFVRRNRVTDFQIPERFPEPVDFAVAVKPCEL